MTRPIFCCNNFFDKFCEKRRECRWGCAKLYSDRLQSSCRAQRTTCASSLHIHLKLLVILSASLVRTMNDAVLEGISESAERGSKISWGESKCVTNQLSNFQALLLQSGSPVSR